MKPIKQLTANVFFELFRERFSPATSRAHHPLPPITFTCSIFCDFDKEKRKILPGYRTLNRPLEALYSTLFGYCCCHFNCCSSFAATETFETRMAIVLIGTFQTENAFGNGVPFQSRLAEGYIRDRGFSTVSQNSANRLESLKTLNLRRRF